ncbi:Listeria-Bacteroides repeat domain-containing protein [Desulfonema limicola]|uniref:Listeria-Bacteroides repeat domain-containing protein n=1 Tax=Desulfonema limicola TaxID=45656 RepID=A0A975GJI9_9BACT|nr:cohesin domain-containing protein [Desulfonema limicola]QTA83472.1 Listeria-Bacteroides repeat domain-containing protein [Desulfonema limicola]
MKKYLYLIILFVICTSNSFALSIALSPQNTDLSAGEKFQVDVIIENASDIGGFQFNILYDPGVVEIQAPEDILLGDFIKSTDGTFSTLGPVIDNNSGKITFGAFTFGVKTGAEGSGTLASVKFTVKNIQNSYLNLENVQLAAMTDGSSLVPDSIENAVLNDGTAEPDPVIPAPIYTIIFNADENGTIEGNTAQSAKQGSSTSPVKAVPSQGYSFTGWTGDYTGNENPLTVSNITDDMKITANFEQETIISPVKYKINFTSQGNGIIEGSTEQYIEKSAESEPVKAVPDEGYYFSGWTGDYTGTENPLVIKNISSDMDIKADFMIKTYTIKVSAGTGGSITPADNAEVEHGGNAEFTITPEQGYKIEDVLIDNESAGAVTSWVFEQINQDHAVEAFFVLETVTDSDDNDSNKDDIVKPSDETAAPAEPEPAEPETKDSGNDGGGGGSCFIGSLG